MGVSTFELDFERGGFNVTARPTNLTLSNAT
jgi:hypothetical protein